MQEVSGPYGPETACLPIDGSSLEELLTDAIQNINGSEMCIRDSSDCHWCIALALVAKVEQHPVHNGQGVIMRIT